MAHSSVISSSKKSKAWVDWALAAGGLALLTAVCYLLLARKFGFYNDDWYLIYAGLAQGSGKFMEIFAGDRPFRGVVVGWWFDWFGTNAFLYSVSGAGLRWAAGLAFYATLRRVWPAEKLAAFVLAALFVVYPGWLDQPNAVDYQSHLLSLALASGSIFASVMGVKARGLARAAWWAAAAVTQAVSLLLMEYYIGMEGLRLALVWAALGAPEGHGWRRWARRAAQTALFAASGLAASAGFMVWRMFFFTGSRAATDIGGMAVSLAADPVYRGLWLGVRLVQDVFNTVLFAWAVPPYTLAFTLRLSESLVGLALAAAFGALCWAAFTWLQRREARPAEARPAALEFLLAGVFAAACAVVPAILGERHVVFADYSRFTLPAAMGAVLALAGILKLSGNGRFFRAAAATLIFLGVWTHYANAAVYAEVWDAARNFWWQVSWRAPGIQPGTVLAANYAVGGIAEDYFLWGPANLIYYPQAHVVEEHLTTPISAVVLTGDTVRAILDGRSLPERERRGLYSNFELSQTLILSQPSAQSCVHVLDGAAPENSNAEEDNILLISARSRIDRVMVDAPPAQPPAAIFGAEPAHDWCYYYQKMGLARQRGDWQEVARLGDEAAGLGLRADDPVEWMPLIQAYAVTGRVDDARPLAPIVTEQAYLRNQACRLTLEDAYGLEQVSPEGFAGLKELFCR